MSQLHFQLATITLSLYSQASESEKVVVRACVLYMDDFLSPSSQTRPQQWTHGVAADFEGSFSAIILQGQYLSMLLMKTIKPHVLGLIHSVPFCLGVYTLRMHTDAL